MESAMWAIWREADDGAPEFIPCSGTQPNGRPCPIFTKRGLCGACRRQKNRERSNG